MKHGAEASVLLVVLEKNCYSSYGKLTILLLIEVMM
jgi:hypothetical protein